MNYETLEIEQSGAVVTVFMNRPERHNAFNEALIADLTACFEYLNTLDSARLIILTGRGKSFSAGADLDWMQRAARASIEENEADARRLSNMLKTIYRCNKPTLAKIHGAAMGGGTGLTAVCDVAIASEKASFALSEVRLGLIPATIGPYVADAIGWRHARRYFLSAEKMTARTAQNIGLIHEVVEEDHLDARVDEIAQELLKGSPFAQAQSKLLLERLRQSSPFNEELLNDTAQRIAYVRSSDDAQEGLSAFFEKRAPNWLGG